MTTLAGATPGTPPSSHAASALRLLEAVRAGLDRHPARDLRHRGQQRQAAGGVGDGLVGDADGAAVDEVFRLVGVRGQVQVGEQDLVLAQHCALDGLGLLDLDDHVGGGENVGRRGGDRRTGGDVILVGTHDAGAGIGLNQHLMAVGYRLGDTARGHPDPVFVILDLRGYTDKHGQSSLERC